MNRRITEQKKPIRPNTVFSLVLILMCACQTSQSVKSDSVPPNNMLSDATRIEQANKERPIVGENLLRLARDYATSDNKKREMAWTELSGYDRSELVKALIRERDASYGADRIAVAFLLCNLEYEYFDNRKIVVDALTKPPHSANIHADWEAGLLGRLIRRGDNSLVLILFEVANWSDGALATELSTIFEELLVREPDVFVSQLTAAPKNTRTRVYSHLSDEDLTKKELDSALARLNSIQSARGSSDARKRKVAKELSEVLSDLRPRLKS